MAAQLAEVERRLTACDLRAVAGGIVVTPKLEERRGDYVPAGGLVFEIADTRELAAQVEVIESEIGDVSAGFPVQIRLAALPDPTFPGPVEEVAPMAKRDALGRAVFRVRCSVTDSSGRLRRGMTGTAKIACGRRTLGGVIARRALRTIDPSLF